MALLLVPVETGRDEQQEQQDAQDDRAVQRRVDAGVLRAGRPLREDGVCGDGGVVQC